MDPDYKRFINLLFTHFGEEEHGDLESWEFLEYAEDCGLIEWLLYDPEVHGEELGDSLGIGPGDQFWRPRE